MSREKKDRSSALSKVRKAVEFKIEEYEDKEKVLCIDNERGHREFIWLVPDAHKRLSFTEAKESLALSYATKYGIL